MGVAGRGVRVCVCARARVRVGMHVVCGQRQSVTRDQCVHSPMISDCQSLIIA